MNSCPKKKPGKWSLAIALPFLFAAWLLLVVLNGIEYSRVDSLQDRGLAGLAWLVFLLPAGAVVTRVGYVFEGDLKWRRLARVLEISSILLAFPVCLLLAGRQ
jgi:hypothetical protein